MSTTLPEVRVEVDRIGENKYRSRACDSAGGDICTHEFDFDPALLINIEAEEYLDKGIARDLNDVLRRPDAAPTDARVAPLVAHGQRLFGYLFGDGAGLTAYLKHDPLARSRGARIVLACAPKPPRCGACRGNISTMVASSSRSAVVLPSRECPGLCANSNPRQLRCRSASSSSFQRRRTCLNSTPRKKSPTFRMRSTTRFETTRFGSTFWKRRRSNLCKTRCAMSSRT